MKSEAQSVVDACRIIAGFSDSPDSVMRTYLSPAVREVHAYLRGWMSRLGMESTIDAVGNLRGLYRSKKQRAPRLLLGSHIDTVPGSGAYDGVLGVVIALSLIELLEGQPLNFDVEIIAFSEEEGVRFATPFIGSRALIGEIDDALLQRADAQGITIEKAIEEFGLSPAEIPEAVLHEDAFAYVEFHIEQGPVLEDLNVGLGIVEAIVGQSRYSLTFRGKSNHAGTTPMHLRHDALAGAAEWISSVERVALATPGLVATVGRVEAFPGAANVIPGEARVSFDIRHGVDSTRLAATAELLEEAGHIASARGLGFRAVQQFDEPATLMSGALADSLEAACLATGARPHRMVSGAGHDAMVVAKRITAGMLFLRSPGGISHHPDEAVLEADVQAALDAGLYFLKHLDAAAFRRD